jgi:acetyltransferase-like isoleucine patch superfamily enzyme
MRVSYFFSKLIKKVYLPAIKNSGLDKKAKICSGSHIVNSKIGRYSYVGNYSSIIDCEIGQFCSISDYCAIGGMSHPLDWVSTSPVMYSGRNCLRTNFSDLPYNASKHTVIENDVWIGDGCHIKAGVHLSTGCVIGMGSVLTKDVGPYEIWAGNPAKLIRKRFDDVTIDKLLKTEWWNWPDEKIKKYAQFANDPERFIEVIESET